jgi:hypothetical protein
MPVRAKGFEQVVRGYAPPRSLHIRTAPGEYDRGAAGMVTYTSRHNTRNAFVGVVVYQYQHLRHGGGRRTFGVKQR